MSIKLIPYDQKYNHSISELENRVVQGKHIQLKLLKDHFLDRTVVFDNYFPCLALNENGEVVGITIGAQTGLEVNGTYFPAGIGFDVKVHPSYRNKGIGRMMAKYVYTNFFKEQNLQKNFITLKLSNAPVVKLTAKAVGKVWLYNFVYLTLSTQKKIEAAYVPGGRKSFGVTLFDDKNLSPDYYKNFEGGLGCFNTGKLYRLRIDKISWWYKQGLKILQIITPRKYDVLPKEKEILDFATLFDHSAANINTINEVLTHLNKKGKKFLLVCCVKKDSIYNYLKKYSINSYGYYILSDFPLSKNDAVTIDVRCL